MKFVVGLLLGGLATLLIATLLNTDLQGPKRLDASAFEQFAVVDDSANRESIVPEALSPEPIKSVTMAPLPAPTEPLPVAEPIPAASLVESAVPTVALKETNQPPSQAEFVPKVQPVESQPALVQTAAAPPVENLITESEVTTAVVWKPFHSASSADGFARRLSTQLGYPFRALRAGPAKYHVVFDYESEDQRELLREQVREITGFSVI